MALFFLALVLILPVAAAQAAPGGEPAGGAGGAATAPGPEPTGSTAPGPEPTGSTAPGPEPSGATGADPEPAAAANPAVAAVPGAEGTDPDAEDEVSGELGDGPPALFAVGLSAGFPSYQTVALSASVQAQYVGFQLKGSWTAAGPYFAAQLRAYPPVPVPVPLYVGVGGGFYGPNASYHAVLGAHVPLGKNLRFDLEAGAANVPLLAERAWAPHVAVGVSYAFPVELGGSGAGAKARESDLEVAAGGGCAKREPDRELLRPAIKATIDAWLDSAQATYGSVYTGLRYSYRISGTSVSGNTASVSVSYSGSAREILTGVEHEASGTAHATFAWTGCGWSNTGVSY